MLLQVLETSLSRLLSLPATLLGDPPTRSTYSAGFGRRVIEATNRACSDSSKALAGDLKSASNLKRYPTRQASVIARRLPELACSVALRQDPAIRWARGPRRGKVSHGW
jgi:hypothetical protein